MANQNNQNDLKNLPPSATVFISRIIKKMRYRKKVRQDVRAELAAHFEDALKECATDHEKEQAALKLIADFGDIKLLGLLLRRAKKRCRPLWRTAVVRALQTVGVLLVCFILYTIWFATGKPAPSVDYLEIFNQMSRPKIPGDDNAWSYYEKAVSLYAEPNDKEFHEKAGSLDREFAVLDLNEQNQVTQWIERNQAPWQEFAAGSAKAYCYRPYAYDPNEEERWLLSVQLPHMADLRDIARLGVWRSRIAAEEGRLDEALDICIVLARAGSHWQGRGTLIEQLVGIAINSLAHQQMVALVGSCDIPAELLEKTYRRLSQIYPEGYPLMDFRGERLMFMDIVQHIFTAGGIGGGHLIPARLDLVDDVAGGSYQDSAMNIVTMSVHAARSMVHARRNETVAKANELYNCIEERAVMTPHQKRLAKDASVEDKLESLPQYRYSLLYMMFPAVDRAAEISFRAKAVHQATLTILALKRWQAQKGSYPVALNDLVSAGLLQELPADPYSGKPLVYRVTADDFTLYSLGPNFEDDAGVPGKDRKGRLRQWVDNGDTVFWPVPKAGD